MQRGKQHLDRSDKIRCSEYQKAVLDRTKSLVSRVQPQTFPALERQAL